MHAAGIARRRKTEPPCRVAREHVALQHPTLNEASLPRLHAFGVERGAGQRARNPRIFLDVDKLGQDFLACRIEQERRAAILRRAAHHGDQVTEQSLGQLRRIQDRDLARR